MNEDAVRGAFIKQAEACRAMGSPFTAGLCESFANNLDFSTRVGSFCLDWTGDPGPSADSIPLRLCGGLNALVLSKRSEELRAAYPVHQSSSPSWELIQKTLIDHEAFLLEWMQSPPQTNEVARSAVIWPALMTVANRTGMPLQLMEVGGSAGLNLQCDRFGYDLGGIKCGDKNSPIQLAPQWRGKVPHVADPQIVARFACDLNPLDPGNDHDVLRLRSYVWPDQRDRVRRVEAAIAIARDHPAPVEKTDAVGWLQANLTELPKNTCTVIYSTIAWQYLPQSAQQAGEEIIKQAAREVAQQDRPLAWVRFEADGETPGGGVRLQLWPDGLDIVLGRADFHARWVEWADINSSAV